MMLLERCQNLHEQIEARNALRRAHKEAEAFRERATDLRSIRESLAGALETVNVLRANGVAVPKLRDPTVAATSLREYERRLAESPLESHKDYTRLKRSVVKVSDEVQAAAAKALESVKRDLPTIEEAFLKQVELIPAYAGQVARIRRERDGLLSGVDLGSMAPVALKRFLESREALRKLADELRPAEFPREVLEFFKAARHEGAPLDKLTDTVRRWLAERDQLKNVRVTVVGR